ncbi:MAG: hypothetical protein GC153_09500 [Alphaproteobacteria bacterium]|nr:hypothetical protein [Alphaproteobacteria bacterium]
MVWSIISAKRRRRLIDEAHHSRKNRLAGLIAAIAVVIYNIVGVADIVSTILSVHSGAGEEVNPVLRAAMANLGLGWIIAKLALQGVISFMVLWFPHRIVLAIFIAAIAVNAWVVYNNFLIAGLF